MKWKDFCLRITIQDQLSIGILHKYTEYTVHDHIKPIC
jgi:hypothetical protein